MRESKGIVFNEEKRRRKRNGTNFNIKWQLMSGGKNNILIKIINIIFTKKKK